MAVCTNTVVDSCLKKGGGIISAPVTNINRRYANKTVKNKTKLCFFKRDMLLTLVGRFVGGWKNEGVQGEGWMEGHREADV